MSRHEFGRLSRAGWALLWITVGIATTVLTQMAYNNIWHLGKIAMLAWFLAIFYGIYHFAKTGVS